MSVEQDRKVYLLAGWGFSADIWNPVKQELEVFCNPKTLDLWHYFAQTEAGNSVPLEQILDRIYQETQPGCIWVAWSMSGPLLTRLVERYPGHIAGLVYVASTPRFLTDDEWAYAIDADEFQLFRENFRRDPTKTIRQFSRLVLAGDSETMAWKKELRDCLIDAQACQAELSLGLQLMAELDCRTAMSNLPIASQFIVGSQDQLLNSQHLADLRELVSARIYIVEGASHAVFLGHQQVFCTIIKSFLMKLNK